MKRGAGRRASLGIGRPGGLPHKRFRGEGLFGQSTFKLQPVS